MHFFGCSIPQLNSTAIGLFKITNSVHVLDAIYTREKDSVRRFGLPFGCIRGAQRSFDDLQYSFYVIYTNYMLRTVCSALSLLRMYRTSLHNISYVEYWSYSARMEANNPSIFFLASRNLVPNFSSAFRSSSCLPVSACNAYINELF